MARVTIKDEESLGVYNGVIISCETKFDVERHYLGTLCRKSHNFQDTGFSVRYKSMEGCVACGVESGAEKRRIAAEEKALLIEQIPAGMKRCPKCEQILPVDSYHKHKGTSSGFSSYCKPCTKLISKSHKSKNADKIRDRLRQKRRTEYWAETLYRGSLSSSKRRSLSHNISRDYIDSLWDKQKGLCYWLGIPMKTESAGNRDLGKVSLDRIDPKLGYEEGNVVLCTTFVNFGKSSNSEEDFLSFIERIREDNIKYSPSRW